ncbi:unnamed protein product [Schistocephalus solidus]|uniref:Uncharacterized protein n=1 Tax=Schistocephalus solidus TaxID=70667 RepID=A0A3P7ETM3_SCHSO|nr:unnamed protein product [Schistocephalus solidus]
MNLPQHGVDAEDSSPLHDFLVRDTMLPAQLQNSAEAAEMKAIQLPGLARVDNPGSRSVKKCRQDDGLVHLQFGVAGRWQRSYRLLRRVGGSHIGFPGAVPALGTVHTIEKDSGKDLPGDVEQLDASVVITEFPVPLPLVEMDGGRVFEILRHLSLALHLLKECCEFRHQPGLFVF